MFYFRLYDLCFCSSWLIGIACILHLVRKYICKFVHVTVNCWFCNTNSKVPFTNRTEWYCMHCDQFNGFNQDGDYVKPIPEQYALNLNNSRFESFSPSGTIASKSNGLCRICNANQELKVRQLAIYEPFRENNYDQEIEFFRQRLEKSYKLCSICEKTVENTLKLKSNLYAKNLDRIFHENDLEIAEFRTSKKKWWIISATFFAILIMMASFWQYYLSKIDLMKNDIVAYFSSPDFVFLSQDHKIIINILLIACMTAVMKLRSPTGRIFGRPLLFAVILYGIQDYLPLVLKSLMIISFIVYIIALKWRSKQPSINCQKLTNNLKNRFIEPDEDERSVNMDEVALSNNILRNNPLCGKFSGLTLGSSSTVGCSKNVPYLFRTTKSIIQPPRLKLDESDWCESSRSSPASSGYESVSNYLKRSSDSISEFDSISQIGNSRNSSYESKKNSFNQKTGSAVLTSAGKRSLNLFNNQNMIAPYIQPGNSFVLPENQYYGVSPSFSPKQSPQVPVNVIFSTIQFILCSFAFFILGFSFQLFVNKLLS